MRGLKVGGFLYFNPENADAFYPPPEDMSPDTSLTVSGLSSVTPQLNYSRLVGPPVSKRLKRGGSKGLGVLKSLASFG
jgi:hypothetical protein